MRFVSKKNMAAPLLLLTVCALTLLSRLVSFQEIGGGEGEIYLTVIVLNLMIFVLPGVFYAKLQGQGYIRRMNLRPIGFSKLPVVFFMFFVMVSGCILLNYFLYATGILNLGDSSSAGNFAFLAADSEFTGIFDLLLTALTFAIVPAVAEEFLFRGVLMSEYSEYGGICQVAVSSLAFAMVHFSMRQLPVFLFCGFILSLTAYITRSAITSMILHMLYNLFALFGESYVWGLIGQRNSTVFFLFIIGTMFLLFLMLGIGEGERLFYTYATSGVPTPKLLSKSRKQGEPKPIVTALFSPAFLLCAALFLITVLIQ